MNILIIQLFRIGDLLQCTPVFRGLKAKYSGCRITLLGHTRLADFMEGHPDIDELVRWDSSRFNQQLNQGEKSAKGALDELLLFTDPLRKKNFDLILNLSTDPVSALLSRLLTTDQADAWLSGGSVKKLKMLGLIMTHEDRIEARGHWARYLVVSAQYRRENPFNLVDIFANLAEAPTQNRKLIWSIGEEEAQEAERIWKESQLTENDCLLGIQPGASRSEKRWPAERYAEVALKLMDEFGIKVVLFGSKNEMELGEQIQKRLHDRAINLMGRTSLRQLPAMLNRCQLLLTNDTAAMHFATAVGVPTLILYYGQVYPWDSGPYGEGHHVLIPRISCYPCPAVSDCSIDVKCLSEIPVEAVLVATRSLLRIGASLDASVSPLSKFPNTRLLRSSFSPEGMLVYKPAWSETEEEKEANVFHQLYSCFWLSVLNEKELPKISLMELEGEKLESERRKKRSSEFRVVVECAEKADKLMKRILDAYRNRSVDATELRSVAAKITPIDKQLSSVDGAPKLLVAHFIYQRESLPASTPLNKRMKIFQRLYSELAIYARWFEGVLKNDE